MTEGTSLLAGRYEVGALIGHGGMADVHLGRDTRLGRKVAIKLLHSTLSTDPKFRLLFREEAQKASRMTHPTIVKVLDAGEETVKDSLGFETQLPFIVMEYIDGRTLKDIIAEGPLEPREAVRITIQVLTALEYAHKALLVHRDIKPGNIMITQSGQVKVMDFGIARAVSDNAATVADTSTMLGTAQYFSPEQARGETVDSRTDLYSTGIVLFELLTGRAPFQAEKPVAVAYQHISEAPPTPSSINPRVPKLLDSVVLKALAKDKLSRYQTAAEFREDLEKIATALTPTDGSTAARKPSAAGLPTIQTAAAQDDFNATLFGSAPGTQTGQPSTVRQVSAQENDLVSHTQSRPPVAWIWGGVAIMAVILAGVAFWLVNLQPPKLNVDLSVQIPDVVGQTYESGAAELTKLTLVPTRLSEPSDTIPSGTITRIDPPVGTKVAKNFGVKVWVSSGRSVIEVPIVTNLTQDAAIKALTDAGLVYGTSSTAHSATIAKDVVLGSSPAGGTQIRQGETVDLLISDGLITVPKVVGLAITDANKQLTALNLPITLIADSSCSGGAVTAQSLTAGDQPQGSPITLTYCSGS